MDDMGTIIKELAPLGPVAVLDGAVVLLLILRLPAILKAGSEADALVATSIKANDAIQKEMGDSFNGGVGERRSQFFSIMGLVIVTVGLLAFMQLRGQGHETMKLAEKNTVHGVDTDKPLSEDRSAKSAREELSE